MDGGRRGDDVPQCVQGISEGERAREEQVNKWQVVVREAGAAAARRVASQVATRAERGDREPLVEQQPLSWCLRRRDIREKVLLQTEQLYFLTSE